MRFERSFGLEWREVDPENQSQPGEPVSPEERGERNPEVEEFFHRLMEKHDLRRPKPGAEAIAAALQAIQRLGSRIEAQQADAEPGALKVRYQVTVDISHYVSEPSLLFAVPPTELPAAVLCYVRPSRYCQSDRVSSMAWQQFGHLEPGYGQAQAVCIWVRDRTRFQPGTSGVNTSALDTLDSCVGVCRDFAHAAISLLRALNYPARIVTGVDYGADPGLGPPDFHCYLDVFLGDRWYLFDPTGICPLTGLIRIATGRDAADVSFATTFGQVRGTMPKLSFNAVEDVAAAVLLPYPTTLAISTASLL